MSNPARDVIRQEFTRRRLPTTGSLAISAAGAGLHVVVGL